MIDSLAAHAKRAETGSIRIPDALIYLLIILAILAAIGLGVWAQVAFTRPTVILQGCGKVV